MPRPPDGPVARSVHFALRLEPREAKIIDDRRGQRSRSEYVRSLIRSDEEQGDATDD